MKEWKSRSYEEFEMREMERFIKKKKEMGSMGKFHDYEDFEGYGKHHNDDHCDCHKKHHKCDDHDKDRDKDRDKWKEEFCCICKKKKEKKKDHVKKHVHKHYHKHEYKHDKKNEKDDHKKEDHNKDNEEKRKRKDKADLVDFVFDQKDPNFFEPRFMKLPEDVPTEVARVTLEDVRRGDFVLLNGVFGLNNNNNQDVDVIIRIRKNNAKTGTLIYQSEIEIDRDNGRHDDRVIEPLLHVDKIMESTEDVTYFVTIEPRDNHVFLAGPVTFTAMLIEKKKKRD